MVNKPAPKFTAAAVVNGTDIVNDFSLEQYKGEKYVVLFFYPKDFSTVCPTELWAFQELLEEFEKRNCAVVGCSTDSEEVHSLFLRIPKSEGGAQGVTYPVVADIAKSISSNFGVLGGEYDYNDEGELTFIGAPIALRGTFLIDRQGIVRHEYVNHFPLGRNVSDTLQVLDSLIHLETNGEACPANWRKGDNAVPSSPEAVKEFFAKH